MWRKKINLQLLPVNIFLLLGTNEEELPPSLSRGFSSSQQQLQAAGHNHTLTQPHNDSHHLILLFSVAGETPEAKLIDANGCLPSKRGRIQICQRGLLINMWSRQEGFGEAEWGSKRGTVVHTGLCRAAHSDWRQGGFEGLPRPQLAAPEQAGICPAGPKAAE